MPSPEGRSRLRAGSVASLDERAPLLARSVAVARPATPLPWRQLLMLLFLRFGEPIATTVIFPFIASMIEDLHVAKDPRDIGFYAGLVESLFALATFFCVLQWGRLSDRIGRRPVILFGLTGVAIAVTSFGFSTSFAWMVASRTMAGILNGNIAVLKSSIGEITDETNAARAFSFLPIPWNIGALLGPLIGGYLSKPATRYPDVFGRIAILRQFPYLLPCLIAGMVPAIGVAIGSFFLEESLPSIVAQKKRDALDPAAQLEAPALEQEKAPALIELFNRKVVVQLMNYALLGFQTSSLEGLIVLFCYTAVPMGGLGFAPSEIGRLLSLSSCMAIAAQLLLFPPLQRRIGTVRLYRLCTGLYPFVFACLPIANLVARRTAGHGDKMGVWLVLTVFLLFRCIAGIVFSVNMLLVTAAAPSRRLLGSMNGTAQMTASLFRSIGPFVGSSLFAVSKRHPEFLNGQGVFALYTVISAGAFAATFAIRLDADRISWRREEPTDE